MKQPKIREDFYEFEIGENQKILILKDSANWIVAIEDKESDRTLHWCTTEMEAFQWAKDNIHNLELVQDNIPMTDTWNRQSNVENGVTWDESQSYDRGMDATRLFAHPFRDLGEYGSHPSHDENGGENEK